jgi:hypothetical protein
VIASIESLLCAVATDKLHSGPRSDLDKELTAQGAGNLVSGLLGGLPMHRCHRANLCECRRRRNPLVGRLPWRLDPALRAAAP